MRKAIAIRKYETFKYIMQNKRMCICFCFGYKMTQFSGSRIFSLQENLSLSSFFALFEKAMYKLHATSRISWIFRSALLSGNEIRISLYNSRS